MDGSGYSPYETGIADKQIALSMDTTGQSLKYKDDEKEQKAPPILPYELEAINQILGNIFVSLAELRTMLATADESGRDIDTHAVNRLKEKIDKINQVIVLEIPEDLDKIAI